MFGIYRTRTPAKAPLLLLGLFVVTAITAGAWLAVQAPRAEAATSSYLNFQARLLNSNGTVVADGNYHIEFKIYDSASAGASAQGVCSLNSSTDDCWWRETRTTGNLVRVVNGYFSVQLGSVTAFGASIPWDQQLWLTMNIGGTGGSASWDGEMLSSGSRIQLTGVPYAFTAGRLQAESGGITNQLVFATPSGSNKTLTLPNETGTVCLQSSSACGFVVGSGSAFLQNGNSFAAAAVLGTNDSNSLSFETNNLTQATIAVGGAATFANSANSINAFRIQNAAGSNLLRVDSTNATVNTGTTNTGALNVAYTNSFPTTQILDDFNRANTGPPPSGNWSQGPLQFTAGEGLQVSSNTVIRKPTGSYRQDNYWNPTTFGPDSEAYVTVVNKVSTDEIALILRAKEIGSTTSDYYVLGVSLSDGVWTIQRQDNNNFNTLGSSFTQAISNGDSVGFSARGSTLTAWYKAAAGSWTALTSREDSTYLTAGYIGLQMAGANGSTLDNFGGGTSSSAFSVSDTGFAVSRNTVNSTTAFQIQNAAAANLLTIDTSTTLNLITNGDIEGGGTTGWTAKGSSTLTRVTTQQWQGNGSLQVATTTAANDGAQYAITLSASTTYRLSFRAKVASGSITDVNFGRQDQSGTDIDCATGQTVNTNWNNYFCAFTTGGTISGSNIYIKKTGAAAETFFIDAIQLELSAGATTFDPGGAIQLNGIINSPVTFRNKSNSSAAFIIQNSAGTSYLFVADTETGRIGIGAGAANSVLTVGTNTTTSTGGITFGTDTNLYRSASNRVKTDGEFQAEQDIIAEIGNASQVGIGNRGTGGTPGITFGSANDTVLYRSAANTLKTDDNFLVQTATNSTAAFQVQNAAGSAIFNTDTLNGRLGINTSAPSYDLSLGEGANRTLGVETRASNAVGRNLTLQAGVAGAGASAFGGGNLNLQGGAAGGTGNANGGNVTIQGGAGVGTGVTGSVILGTPTFSTASQQNCGSNCNITQSNIDGNGAVLVNATATSLTVTLTDPTITTAGKVVYVTAANGSNDFTLSVNGGGTGNLISMRQNTTATMVWNGSDWTAAGASSSTTLQAAYDNTLTAAGGAELVLNPLGGNADGLTIRNNGTTPIIGSILEAQTSVGSNLLSVNNNATEYANNGGAESSTFTMWTGAPAGGTIARHTTLSNVATGQASVSVTTTATAAHGVENTLSATLTNALKYQVSFAIKADSAYSAFTTLDVMYSYDGTAVRHCVSGTPYYNAGTASQSGTTITGVGTTFTSAMVGKTFVYADGTSTVISGYTSATQLTAATSQTVASQNYGIYDAGYTVKTSVWSRVTCTFTAPASGTTITSANSVMIRQTDATARVFYIDNLSVTVGADVNHAVDGSVDLALGSNWTAFGTLDALTRETTIIYDTGGSVAVDAPNSVDRGVRNNMTISPSTSTQYLVTFYARSSNSFNDIRVRYSRDGGTNFVSCADYNTQSLSTTSFTKITCIFTSDSTTATNPDLIIDQPTASDRIFYIDALSVTLNTNTASNVQIGGANEGGPITLLTLDRSSSAPIASNNDAYLGSLYYDTNTGRIQCYEADGWGACGAAPDNVVNLNPEYAGAVLNGTGVGTMTANLCSNDTALSVNSSLCATGEAKNYYQWTSPQSNQQTYSIYVSYQLPSTFDGFISDDTVQLVARASSTTNAAVTYQMFKSTGLAVTQCGSGETTVVTTANTWQSVGINGNESTGCSFSSSSAGNFVIFKINLKANSNANAYVSTLSFTTKGR